MLSLYHGEFLALLHPIQPVLAEFQGGTTVFTK
jgi:hypothetical protein